MLQRDTKACLTCCINNLAFEYHYSNVGADCGLDAKHSREQQQRYQFNIAALKDADARNIARSGEPSTWFPLDSLNEILNFSRFSKL